MPKSIAVQLALSAVLGPVGLAYSNLQIALGATALTLTALIVFKPFIFLIGCITVILSMVCGVMLVRTERQREETRNFQLSTFVGQVSCQVTNKGKRQQRYQPILNRLRFRKRLNQVFNCTLVGLCFVLAALIVNPQWIAKLKSNLFIEEIPPAGFNNITPPTDSAETVSLSESEHGYIIKSKNFVIGSNGAHRARLSLTCVDNRTYLSLVADDVLGTDNSDIIIALDNNELVKQRWKIEDQLHQARARSPISTLQRIGRSNKLSLQYRAFGSDSTNTAVFDVSDVKQATESVRKRCHW